MRKPAKIVLLYCAVSLMWIFSTGKLVQVWSLQHNIEPAMLESLKGFLFVTVTALLLYVLIKKQTNELKKSAKQYKNLFLSNPNPLWIYEIKTLRFIAVNNATIQFYGYSAEEFREMTILDIRPKTDHTRLKESVQEVRTDLKFSGYWQHRKKDGTVFTTHITSHKIRFNNLDCAMVMANDVTERLEQEKKLKALYQGEKELKEEVEKNLDSLRELMQQKQNLTAIIDRIHNMVIITDPASKIIWVNPAFENFTGYHLDEVCGKTPYFLHGPKTDPNVNEKIFKEISDRTFGSIEVINYTKSGKEYWVELNISPIYNEEEEIVRLISIQNIITERKLREQTIQEQNNILRELAWNNSHALRRPVASLLSLISISKETASLEEIKEVHELAESSVLQLDAEIKTIAKTINTFERNS